MLKWFQCPDKQLIEVTQCLTKCRMSYRCWTKPTLSVMGKEREWHGVPSTTQLLNGTMLEFLKLTKDYSVDPQDRAFALHGTHVHESLEQAAKELGLPSEIAMSVDRDVFDLLEPDGDGWILTDNKTWGSYRVVRALGLVAVGKVPDPSGEVYKTSGKWGKAGSPKMVNKFQIEADKADMWETEMQLNRYRVMLEERGLNITKMQCQIIVRDGGLEISRSRGIDRNGYLIPVRRLDSNQVVDYFHKKYTDLLQAMEAHSWTEVCNPRECWDDRRCVGYCEVALYCTKGILLHTGENVNVGQTE